MKTLKDFKFEELWLIADALALDIDEHQTEDELRSTLEEVINSYERADFDYMAFHVVVDNEEEVTQIPAPKPDVVKHSVLGPRRSVRASTFGRR